MLLAACSAPTAEEAELVGILQWCFFLWRSALLQVSAGRLFELAFVCELVTISHPAVRLLTGLAASNLGSHLTKGKERSRQNIVLLMASSAI